MIDSLFANLERAGNSDVLDQQGLAPEQFGVLTLHRPSNVDDPGTTPFHPRTAERLRDLDTYRGMEERGDLRILPPLGYLDFLRLYSKSKVVFTDSGGLQEETTALRIPCVTIRENTERPITVSEGSNTVVGTDPEKIEAAARAALNGRARESRIPDLWDGKTAVRIVDVFEAWWGERSRA